MNGPVESRFNFLRKRVSTKSIRTEYFHLSLMDKCKTKTDLKNVQCFFSPPNKRTEINMVMGNEENNLHCIM